MSMKVAALFKPASSRSQGMAQVMCAGVQAVGDHCDLISKTDGLPDADVIIAYGWVPFHRLFEQQLSRGRHYVFIDLGYWGRKTGLQSVSRTNRFPYSLGTHKLSVDSRHPTKGWPLDRPPDRFKEFELKIKPWRKGENILIAGMSEKAARTYGYEPQDWEKQIVKKLKEHTDRKIIYRPKPSDVDVSPIPGCGVSPNTVQFQTELNSAHAVISRHSNAAVEGLLEGVQIYSEDNVGKFMSIPSFDMLEDGYWPDGREQFMNDVAYCHWSVDEIISGKAWKYLRDFGFLA